MKQDFALKTFEELSNLELYEILRLRAEVFVVEQNCAYQDLDDLDSRSLHLTQRIDGFLVGYTRILYPGLDFEDACAIGRVITSPKFRRQGYGRPLMQESIRICKEQWPSFPIKIHAQSYLLAFYGSFGFEPYGEEFLEDGLPHWFMQLSA